MSNTCKSLCRVVRKYSNSTASTNLRISSIPAPHIGTIQIIALDRPQSRNAISKNLLSELSYQIESLHTQLQSITSGPHPHLVSDTPRALIITSTSPSCFCSGADLKERLTFTPEQTTSFLTLLRHTFSQISSLPIPTISAVTNLALGGGLELALSTHFRIFASSTVVGLPETRLGIIPGAGGTYRLPQVIGLQKAREMILLGKRIDAKEAYRIGLCDRVVKIEKHDQDDRMVNKVLDGAINFAGEICEGGPIGVMAALEAVNGWKEGESCENKAYEKVLGTKDRMEALKAFSEKRKPIFMGR